MENDSPSVECYSGTEYAERPTALYWQGQRLQIAEILARSRTPGSKFFRVSTEDHRVFELHYTELLDEWLIKQV